MIPFVKGHGLGNDYIVLEGKDLNFPLTPLAVQRLCHRNLGIGADGILLLVESSKADFGLRIFNPDGSEAEKSGNGLRILPSTSTTTAELRRRRSWWRPWAAWSSASAAWPADAWRR